MLPDAAGYQRHGLTDDTIESAVSPGNDMEWAKQRRSAQEFTERISALPRSSSLDSQSLAGLQPQTNHKHRVAQEHAPGDAAVGGGGECGNYFSAWKGGYSQGSEAPNCPSGRHRPQDEPYHRAPCECRVSRRVRPRPSSARGSATTSPCVDRTQPCARRCVATGDTVQVSYFPLLSTDDDTCNGQHDPNQGPSAPISCPDERSGASLSRRVSAPDTRISTKARLGNAPPRAITWKGIHQREKGIGQPFRAQFTTSLTAGAGPGAGGWESCDAASLRTYVARDNGHKQTASNCLALAAEANANLVVGRGPSPRNCSPQKAGGTSSCARTHGDEVGCSGLLRQQPNSASSSSSSSPRVSSTTPCRSSPCAPPHGGRNAMAMRDSTESNKRARTGGASVGATCRNSSGNASDRGRGWPFHTEDAHATRDTSACRSAPTTPSASSCTAAVGDIPRQEASGSGKDCSTSADVCRTSKGEIRASRGPPDGGLSAVPEGGEGVRELEGGTLVVRRSEDEKKRSPERLNLHRRQLKCCPLIQGDNRLRLLNYQNNLISKITNLANLPNLIFLDLYNNLIDTLEGPLATMSSLRVIMVGKNRIDKISHLDGLCKLDVLDLHSNFIRSMNGLSGLQELRVLNLAGNKVRIVEKIGALTSLTELNLRRNVIEEVTELDALPRLQRLFLSNNRIKAFKDCQCIFSVRSLLELSLDGNPVAGTNGLGSAYRRCILQHLPSLHHLDLKRVTDHDQPLGDHPSAARGQARCHADGDAVCRCSVGGQNEVSGPGGNKVIPVSRTVRAQETFPVLGSTQGQDDFNGDESRDREQKSVAAGTRKPSARGTSSSDGSRRDVSRPRTDLAAPSPPGKGLDRTSNAPPRPSGQSKSSGGSEGAQLGTDAAGNRDNTTRCDYNQSRAQEARDAVTAQSAREDRDEREKRALKERADAIDAARERWKTKVSELQSFQAKSRNRLVMGSNGRTKTKLSAASSQPPVRSQAQESCLPAAGQACGSKAQKPETRDSTHVRRPRGENGGSSNRSSGGIGYFELEQCLSRIAPGGGDEVIDKAITLKVYGDVWRWLSDGKVCSLRHKIVEAEFSYVHVNSLAKKAAAITETFPNLARLRLLDNDLRSLKQLERLRPLLSSLTTLALGQNPVVRNASNAAVRAWVKAQGRGLSFEGAPDDGDLQRQEESHHSSANSETSDTCSSMLKKETLLERTSSHTVGGSANKADAAFGRLMDARNRILRSAWGNVTFMGSERLGRESQPRDPSDEGGAKITGTSATSWKASSPSARSAYISMIRRVCEAQRRDREFDRAWDEVVFVIANGVVAKNNDVVMQKLREAPSACGEVVVPSMSCHDAKPWRSSSLRTDCLDVRREINAVRTRPPQASWLDDP